MYDKRQGGGTVDFWIFPLVLMLVLLFSQRRARAMLYLRLRSLRGQRRTGGQTMEQRMLERFLGQECLICFGVGGETLIGTIDQIEENWLLVTTRHGEREMVCIDFISRIRALIPKRKAR